MKKMKIIIPLLGIVLAVVFFLYVKSLMKSHDALPKLFEVPAFSWKNQYNEPVDKSVFNNHITVVDFIFTNCPGLCPMMASRMTKFYKDYAKDNRIQFISFSVDPARDSLRAIQAYAQRYEVTDKRWQFVRTDSTIQQFYEQGFKLGGELPRGHSGAFVLVDGDGFIRGYYDSNLPSELEQLRQAIALLKDE
ncbi:MAG: SCO family protein [Calditrichaeota bacterium]|nr:MAG: SCO family protein [Calditrichota bacterium]